MNNNQHHDHNAAVAIFKNETYSLCLFKLCENVLLFFIKMYSNLTSNMNVSTSSLNSSSVNLFSPSEASKSKSKNDFFCLIPVNSKFK